MFMCIQAAIAIVTLEVVNYIEHYGLTRETVNGFLRLFSQKIFSVGCVLGKLEPVGVQHSWNADWAFTCALVFQLQRHAHHHIKSKMPYQVRSALLRRMH